MALPGVTISIQDGNLNQVAGAPTTTLVSLGVCTDGAVNTLAAYGSASTAASALGSGSLAAYAAYHLGIAGVVTAMAVNPSQPGSVGSVTHAGSGTGTMAVAAAPHKSIAIAFTTGGALGTSKFTYNVASAGASAPQATPVGNTFRVPGTYQVINFAAGNYNTADGYTFATDGTISHTGGGGSPALTSSAVSPIDEYSLQVSITTSGALGTAQATYSLDGGLDISAPFTIPANGVYVISGAGLVLTFSGSQTAGDTFSCSTCGPGASGTDWTAAFTALQANLTTAFSLAHVIQGQAFANAQLAVTQATAMQAQADALHNLGQEVRILVQIPTLGDIATVASTLTVDSVDTDGYVASAVANLSALRICACAGSELLFMPDSGLTLRRNLSWGAAAALASVSPSTDAACPQSPPNGGGAITGVSALSRNEFLTQALDAARLTTMRTITGDPGYYLTNVRLMAPLGSDFAYITNGRVVDEAAYLLRQAATPLINGKVQITQNPRAPIGSISAGQADQLDEQLTAVLSAAMVSSVPQDAVAVSVQVDRNANVLATGMLPIQATILPFGYSRQIKITIGFEA